MPQPPRASSVHDPDYDWRVGAKLLILFDGQPIDQVISYDCDKGEVLRYQTDERGRPFVVGDEIATEKLHGQVEARWKADAQACPHCRA